MLFVSAYRQLHAGWQISASGWLYPLGTSILYLVNLDFICQLVVRLPLAKIA